MLCTGEHDLNSDMFLPAQIPSGINQFSCSLFGISGLWFMPIGSHILC